MRRILLVEPDYRNKYPPLGLMKISTYHKTKGDYVEFTKGCLSSVRAKGWDRIYVSTLFTFHWKKTIETIAYYAKGVASPGDVFVGGVMATLLAREVRRDTNATVIEGLIDAPGILDKNDHRIVDHLIPDYSILDEIKPGYELNNAYLGYATRGCPNRCAFCAVSTIEPKFTHYLPIKRQVRGIEEVYGPKKDLILLDNNVLASRKFERIIHDLIDLGFQKGAMYGRRRRMLDFNQGVDGRLLNKQKMRLLARTAIFPLRIAFDHVALKDEYVKCVRMANDFEIPRISSYVLYNYTDTPQDFYERLRVSVELNQELGTHIYSFPMKYIPLDAKDRSFVGRHWSRKLIRGVQCILLATRGKVGTNLGFFEAAFGADTKQFLKIAVMPERYIIYREHHKLNGAHDWSHLYDRLTSSQRAAFMHTVNGNHVCEDDVCKASTKRLKEILDHYVLRSP
jgi:hypothetical protein